MNRALSTTDMFFLMTICRSNGGRDACRAEPHRGSRIARRLLKVHFAEWCDGRCRRPPRRRPPQGGTGFVLHDELVLVFQRIRQRADQVEQAVLRLIGTLVESR
jgi:hypothetical protein